MDPVRIIYYFSILGLPLVLGLLWWWWADRRLRPMPGSGGWRLTIAAFTLVFSVCYVWLLVTRWMASPWTPHPWIMAYMLLWGLIFLPFLALPSIVGWSIWRAGWWSAIKTYRLLRPQPRASVDATVDDTQPLAKTNTAPAPQRTSMNRREMLEATLVSLPMLATLGATAYSIPQKRRFLVNHKTLTLPGLPPDLHGMTIAHLSDTHVGKFTRGRVLDRIVKATNDLEADLVVLTGDVIDHSVYDLPEALAMIDDLHARHGVYVCEGNHDLFDGRDRFRGMVLDHGVDLLIDEVRPVKVRDTEIDLMGIAWHERSKPIKPHVDRVATTRDPQKFGILLAHHPEAFDHAAAYDIPLTLAGHTHGGQLMINDGFGGGPMLFKYWSGLYRKNACQLVVSNGTGNWFPLRVNAPAEIVHLTLKSSEAADA